MKAACTDFYLLLRLRLQTARGAVRLAGPAQRGVGLLLGLGAVVLFVLITVLFGALLSATRTVQPALLAPLIERTVLFLFLFLLAGAVPFVSSTLFTFGDLPLLASTPIRPAALVCARLVDAVVVSSAQFVVIGVPLLVASVSALEPPAWAWLAALPVLLLFLALPALLVALLLLGLALFVGVRHVRRAVALVSVLLAVGMCLLMVSELSQSAGRGFTGLAAPGPTWQAAFSPAAWTTRALSAFGSGQFSGAVGPALFLLAAALVSWLGCVAMGRRVLAGETLLEDGVGARGRVRILDNLLASLPLAPPIRALLAKDVRYISRDLVLLSQIGIPAILYLVPFVIGARVGGAGKGGVSASDLFVLSAGIIATIAFMETSILSLSSIGLEGGAFWIVLHAPVSAGMLVRAKWLGAWGGSVFLCAPLVLLSGIVFRAPALWIAGGLGVLIVACGALCGFGVGVAGIFPRFLYDNPAHRASLSALIWGFVGATVYVVLAGLILGGGALAAVHWPERGRWLVGGAGTLFVLLSLITGLVPLLLACRRLEGYAWEH